MRESPEIGGYLFGGTHNKDYSILGSILGSPYFGELSCIGIFLDIYAYACTKSHHNVTRIVENLMCKKKIAANWTVGYYRGAHSAETAL